MTDRLYTFGIEAKIGEKPGVLDLGSVRLEARRHQEQDLLTSDPDGISYHLITYAALKLFTPEAGISIGKGQALIVGPNVRGVEAFGDACSLKVTTVLPEKEIIGHENTIDVIEDIQGENRGFFVGPFKDEKPQKTDVLAVGYKTFTDASKTEAILEKIPHTHFKAVEVVHVVHGLWGVEVYWKTGSKKFEFTSGDTVVLGNGGEFGTRNFRVEVGTEMLVVHTPPAGNDKHP
jgi:hypothetical protein